MAKAIELYDLRPTEGSKKKRKRVGRGNAGKGGTYAGRGRKGQNARSGGGKQPYFEGGQLPLARRLPYKRGFTNIRKVYYTPVNLRDLSELDAGTEVNPEALSFAGLVKKPTDPIVILGEGEISVALTIKAHRFSKSARQKIEAAGGSVEVLPLSK